MKWLPRFLWLLVWSLWAWLGFGLYRELPRNLGPALCRLPLKYEAAVRGFVGDEPLILSDHFVAQDKPSVISVWDARTGRLVRDLQGPVGGGGGADYYSQARLFDVGVRPSVGGKNRLASLDIRSGQWTDLPTNVEGDPIYHADRPWAAFWGGRGAAFVIDLRSGAELLRWQGKRPGKRDREVEGPPFFVGDRLGVVTRPRLDEDEDYDPSMAALEIWSIPAGSQPERVVEGLAIGSDPIASTTGRIAWHIIHAGPFITDVYDLNVGRFVFSDPPRETRAPPSGGASGGWSGPRLSRDGSLVLSTMANKLWEIDTGRELWPARNGAALSGWDELSNIEIREEWSLPYEKDHPWITFAVRDARSGRLLRRCWKATLGADGAWGALLLDRETLSVHELPPRVNYPLLALCQTILALPLVLTWLALRWRRRRRARLTVLKASP